MNEVLHTEWGTARLTQNGYYQISSSNKGNQGKLLHISSIHLDDLENKVKSKGLEWFKLNELECEV